MGVKADKESKINLRQKAESLLSKKNTDPQLSEAETLKLIHELQVHQIELELQYEELVSAKEQATTAFEKYEELYDFAPCGYYTVNKGSEITGLNFRGAEMLGKERSLLIGTRFISYVSIDSLSVFNLFIDRVFKSKLREACDISLSVISDLPAYIHLSGKVDENSEHCLITAFDISDRTLAEKAMLESEEQFRNLANLLPVGIYLTDPDGNCLYTNPAWCKMAGLSKKEALGKGWIDGLHPDDREMVFANWNKMVMSKGEWGMEYRFCDKQGNITLVYGLASPQYDPSGRIIRYVGANIDITKRKQMEDDLLKAKEHAEEAGRLKTAFLNNMSHEIRTPMNAIMGFSELLVKQYNNKPKLEEFSHIINQRCGDLLVIINDILDIAKIESGQLTVNLEPCNINLLFAELKSFFTKHQKKLKKEGVALNFLPLKGESSELIVVTDKVKLKQILINLIGNAFKFTAEGIIESSCMFDSNNNLLFYVRDTGIGIQPDKLDIIFERFTQLGEEVIKGSSGTGLGLSIVKGLIKLLGGEIYVESEYGKGSIFSFTIPYIKFQPLPTGPELAIETTKFNFTNKTILVVEDDYYNAIYLNEVLAEVGLKILQTEYGKKAVEISLNQQVDMVLLDIRLPDIDGYEATRIIKQGKPDIKIIAQTAYASKEDRQRALNAGCDDYISKPVKIDMLLEMVNKYLLKK
jgi:PAS domain S-box-containing protein